MTPIELASYYCPQEANEAKRRQDTFALRTDRWFARDAAGYQTRWKVGFDSRILWLSPLANARGSQGMPDCGTRTVGVPGRPAAERPREGFCSFLWPS